MLDTISTNVGQVNVNSVKAKDIKTLLNAIDRNKIQDIIDEAIIFGSSIKESARYDSDIDICFLTYMKEYDFHKKILSAFMIELHRRGFKSDTDIFIYKDREELNKISKNTENIIEQAIQKEGITVYRRGK